MGFRKKFGRSIKEKGSTAHIGKDPDTAKRLKAKRRRAAER